VQRSFPFPLPNGWFQVAYSDEVAPGELRPLRYFGTDLVLFRGEDGQAHVLDAYCPHMGANLGCGGKVDGDHLRCPFHAWAFDGDGNCVEIPYAKRIPQRAKLRSWRVDEKNGLIMVHYHKQGKPPTFELPDVPEYASEDWTDYYRREFTVRSRNQELAENCVDPAHFKYVHRTAEIPEAEAEVDGHLFKVKLKYPIAAGDAMQHGDIQIVAYGMGFGVTRFSGIVDTTLVISGTPIDDERVHQRFSFMVKKLDDPKATEGLGKAFVSEISRQFAEDLPIWENKVFLERPLLCDGDGPIAMLRRWGQQFY
jgi:phenylpropionate dioxygenase-like ring-hydroxylating dioxygenase large terminal subunit